MVKVSGTDPLGDLGILDLPPADHVTALRVVGEDVELPLSLDQCSFTLGSAREQVDLWLRNPYASAIHVAIHRRDNKLWIIDKGSSNGTYFAERREKASEVNAGDKFRIADQYLLCLDEQMRAVRPHLQWCLGLDAHALVDETLEIAATGDHVLLLGEAGCEEEILARAIHDASPRRQGPFVALTEGLCDYVHVLESASKGSIFIDIARTGVLKAPFVNGLFSKSKYHARAIVAGAKYQKVEQIFGRPNARLLHQIDVPPLRKRGAEIPRLLDVLFAVHGSSRRADELGIAANEALIRFAWPNNFADLRRQVPKLLAVLEENGNLSAAARRLGISRPALTESLERLGLWGDGARW